MIVLALILFYMGWTIFWNAVGPQLKWVETVSVENTLHLLDGMQEQGLLVDGVDEDVMMEFALSPATDRLTQDIGDAYRTPVVYGFLVMLISIVVLVLCCIPNKRDTQG